MKGFLPNFEEYLDFARTQQLVVLHEWAAAAAEFRPGSREEMRRPSWEIQQSSPRNPKNVTKKSKKIIKKYKKITIVLHDWECRIETGGV